MFQRVWFQNFGNPAMTLSSDTIVAEYDRLGHKLGWRFLTCPERNVEKASVALVTINPGGGSYEPPKWSVEEGSAYVVESWKGGFPGEEHLQRQVRRMFEIMNVAPESVLSGYLVPFRSRDWGSLQNKPNSLRFGVDLWREVFRQARGVSTVVAFGKKIEPQMISLLAATLHARHDADWGEHTIDVYDTANGGRLLVLPHLSRYALFGRPDSEEAFRRALDR
jgi:hypothetical protein